MRTSSKHFISHAAPPSTPITHPPLNSCFLSTHTYAHTFSSRPGVPRETYPGEHRVALSPAAVKALLKAGFKGVVVEEDAGGRARFEVGQSGGPAYSCAAPPPPPPPPHTHTHTHTRARARACARVRVCMYAHTLAPGLGRCVIH